MSSKAITFLCLMALLLMIASVATARDLAETDAVEKDGYGGGGYGRGGGGGYGRGGGGGYGRGGGYRGYCKWGCCGYGYYHKCRCCSYSGQAVDSGYVPEAETKPHH